MSCELVIELQKDEDVHFVMALLTALWDWNRGRIKSLNIREKE